jgi:uncharacterized membrane protein
MLLVIAGFVIGGICGSAYFGYHSWELSALLGALAGLVINQKKKLEQVELTLKQLLEEQKLAKTRASRTGLSQQAQQQPPSQAAITTPVVANRMTPTPEVAQAQPKMTKAQYQQEEVLDLDLPDLSLSTPKPIVAEPRKPDLLEKALGAITRFFTQGNPIVRVGMVVMFFGMSFLVKYASSQGLLPIELRLTAVLVAAAGLLVFGWRTRQRAGGYGLVLQAGGIAIIYLTLFAAAALYKLLPMGLAFGLLFLVVVLGAILALLQNAQVLAILATAGGFLAPILTSTGQGSHVGLFSFYLIINLGILAIALHKTWRLLNWVGFLFTFVISAAWGILKYQPEQYLSSQPFLVAFFILYLTVSILFSLKQPANFKGLVDGSLVFGLPLVAFGLQAALLKHTDYGLALSALGLAAVYIWLSWLLARRYMATQALLIQAFLALGISFATLAVPLALNASWTSVTWALEAVGLLWVGLRQQMLRSRLAAYGLHAAAACSLVLVHGLDTGLRPLLDGDFLALALLAGSDLAMAFLLFRYQDRPFPVEKLMAMATLGFGLLWWFVAIISETKAHCPGEHQFGLLFVLLAASGFTMQWLGDKLRWKQMQLGSFCLLPLAAVLSASFYEDSLRHPAQNLGLAALATFLVVHYRMLFSCQNKAELNINPGLLGAWHILGSWWLFGLVFWEASWQQDYYQLYDTTDHLLWFAAFAAPLAILVLAWRKPRWPLTSFEPPYKNWVPAPLLFFGGLWFISVSNKTIASSHQYLPLLNPLDLSQAAVILLVAYAFRRGFLSAFNISRELKAGILGLMLFAWINLVCLRALSHYQSIAFEAHSLWASVQVQMALSILWTLCALFIMNLSRRLQHRQLWIIGAGLLGLVVLKLFTQDLTSTGTLARIVSFLMVGGLMLLIGFLSPIPGPAKIAANSQHAKAETEAEDGSNS